MDPDTPWFFINFIYFCPFLKNGSNPHNLHFKILKEMRSILLNVAVLDFKKRWAHTGNT